MQLRTLAVAALLLGTTTQLAQAQIRSVQSPARNWVGGFAGIYTTLDALYAPDVDGTWLFGDNALVYGGAIEREFSSSLTFGIEGSYATTEWEERVENVVQREGDANVLAGFVTGRLGGGGSGNVAFYLRGGIGTIGYKVPDADATDYDFALTSGAGIEYRIRSRAGLFLEWNQYWAYHDKGGIDDANTGRHSMLRGGVRVGF